MPVCYNFAIWLISSTLGDSFGGERKRFRMRTTRIIVLLASCLLVLLAHTAWSGPVYTIEFINGSEKESGVQTFQDQIRDEINALMKSRGKIQYQTRLVPVFPPEKSVDAIAALTKDTAVDCFISVGFDITDRVARQESYPRPVIAVGVVDHKLQGIQRTAEKTSGVHNFNYIESHFDIEQDLRTFKSLYEYRHLAVVLPRDDARTSLLLENYFSRIHSSISPESDYSIIIISPDHITPGIPEIPESIDAVYLLPLFSEKGEQQMAAVIREVNNRKLPSFALLGESHVRLGAMAAIAPARNISVMARRVAINVLEILEGRDPATLPVSISRYAQNFVVNVETLQKIDFYPAWTAVEKARLINLEKLHQKGPGLQLKQVIFEALERNLDYLSAKTATRIQEEEAGKAGAALLPQVSLSAGVTQIDEERVEISQTYPAQTTLLASAGLDQIVFSDDILANRAIQNMLTRAQQHEEATVLLDTVLTAARAYINLLLATSAQTIHNDNLGVTRKNLEIAKNKASVGTVNASEVSRWESEMAANQISLNDAFRDQQLARMTLNQVLDRPITRDFTIEDITPGKGIELMITDSEVYQHLGNLKKVRRFSRFLILETDRYLPELRQIRENIKASERQVLNRERALYLPDVVLQGSVDKVMKEYNYREKTPSDLDHPWTVSLMASWPLFTGGADKKALSQSRWQLKRQQLQERNMVNQYHMNTCAKLETAAVSAREIDLAQTRHAAALKSFEIIQAGYAEGRNSVTELIDAQNAKLGSEQALASARYQFVLDLLEMERATGRFYFLDTPDEKQAFFNRLKEHMETTLKDNA